MGIQILLSTYNGEKYIADQIESIMHQSYQKISLLIRDDGSEDDTVKYIEKYAMKYQEGIRFFIGSNVGVKKSFFELLRLADPNSSYYCFCDQDDVWLNNKLQRAVSVLDKEEDQSQPLLFFTPTYLTDSSLKGKKVWPQYRDVHPSFYNALVDNIVVGTTATINNRARDLLLCKNPDFHQMIMHDWWSYLCISAFGKVIYDKEPSVLYRQHQKNLVGGNKNSLELLRRKWQSYSSNKGSRYLYKQAVEFMECYGEYLCGEKKRQLELFISPRKTLASRINYLNGNELYRHSFPENILLNFLILTGYI